MSDYVYNRGNADYHVWHDGFEDAPERMWAGDERAAAKMFAVKYRVAYGRTVYVAGPHGVKTFTVGFECES